MRERTVRLQYGSRVEAVYVLGTYLWTDVYSAAPAGAQTFSLKHTERVQVDVVRDGQAEEVATNGRQRWPLSPSTTLRLSMSQASTEAGSDKVTVSYYEKEGSAPIDQAGLFLTAIEISLDVDADRDGVVEKNNPRKVPSSGQSCRHDRPLVAHKLQEKVLTSLPAMQASWSWGPEGQGAILLVNCDRDTPWLPKEDCSDQKVYSKEGASGAPGGVDSVGPGNIPLRPGPGRGGGRRDLGFPGGVDSNIGFRLTSPSALDLKDMSQMILRTKGPDRLPAGYEMVLYLSMSDSDKVGVFYVESECPRAPLGESAQLRYGAPCPCKHFGVYQNPSTHSLPPDPFFGQRYIHILGREKLYHVVKYTGGMAELLFFVEGLRFPDEGFSGLVSIHVSLLEYMAEEIPLTPIFTDTVTFRIAPWVMTPNTLPPVSVFVCCMKDNYLFLKEIKNLVEKTNCELKVCFQYMNRGDRWIQNGNQDSGDDEMDFALCAFLCYFSRLLIAQVTCLSPGPAPTPQVGWFSLVPPEIIGQLSLVSPQDEIEFGYIEAPHKGFPVVLDSPRDGNLKDFPIKQLLGPDFGYVTREPLFEPVTSLDSFGNLEATAAVNTSSFPVGSKPLPEPVSLPVSGSFHDFSANATLHSRGSRGSGMEGNLLKSYLFPNPAPRSGGRRMTKVVRDFLQAQQVQPPVELYSDWLTVGHVDEFMTFVPIPGTKQFRMLMASTSACYKLFREKQKEGHGEAIMFKGLGGMSSKRITINKILCNESLVQENLYFQRCLDWNRDILKRELGLSEQDIIDLPALFKMDENRQARAYFPNMVNMIVLNKDLGIPKPFGPQVEEECCLEKRVRALLEPLGLSCTFLDDISAYHKYLGEVHCGTNVRRKPFPFKWWHMVP
ncbi:Protein-arginine deiminase type-2 [Galemys pyrenaicus]|uniref:Protein-arginine deiminase type-2 n=1 Tax=Galemys pyrenaicus TaxID=202257 RepID=A0A8J6DGB7_GALPY|nr:Protein-arginine deiminase type-2 [Galemys pyrenaicus]